MLEHQSVLWRTVTESGKAQIIFSMDGFDDILGRRFNKYFLYPPLIPPAVIFTIAIFMNLSILIYWIYHWTKSRDCRMNASWTSLCEGYHWLTPYRCIQRLNTKTLHT